MTILVDREPHTMRIRKPETRIAISNIGIFFKPWLYKTFKNKYPYINIALTTFFKYRLQKIETIPRIAIISIDLFIDTSPEAIGLLDFWGCNLSLSASFISLIIYTIEDTAQNPIKQTKQSINLDVLNNSPLQAKGAKTNKFFI